MGSKQDRETTCNCGFGLSGLVLFLLANIAYVGRVLVLRGGGKMAQSCGDKMIDVSHSRLLLLSGFMYLFHISTLPRRLTFVLVGLFLFTKSNSMTVISINADDGAPL